MADSHRPVSRYKDSFPSESNPQALQTHQISDPNAFGFQQSSVYDKYARPSARNGPQESTTNPTVRPRTSRGQRRSIDLSDDSMDYSIDTTVNRPKTGRGRRSSTDHVYENKPIMIPDGTTPIIDASRLRKNSETGDVTDDCGRPRTARGRRLSEAPPGPSTSPVDQELVRPKTSKGRRSTIAGPAAAVVGHMTSPRQASDEVNVLTMDAGYRVRTGRQRRSSIGMASGVDSDAAERPMARRIARHASVDIVGDFDRSMVPSPPDHHPSPRRHRPKSRYKNRQDRSYSQDSGAPYPRSDSVTSDASRPPTASTLNRFTPLPGISAKGLHPSPPPMNNAEMALAVQRLQLNNPSPRQTKTRPRSHYEIERECNVSNAVENDSEDTSVTGSQSADTSPADDDATPFRALQREVTLIPEPTDSDKVTLGIKLPNGQRIQRAFHFDDPLIAVIEFAEVSAQLDFSGCELVCIISGPRQVFSDLTLTLAQSGIQNRTLLHIEKPDEP